MNTIKTAIATALMATSLNAAAWVSSHSVDAMSDDAITTAVHVEDRSALVVRCKNGDLDAHWRPFEYVGSSKKYVDQTGEKSMVYRIDGGDMYRGSWGLSTDNRAMFAPNPEFFVKQLQAGGKIALRTTNYHGTEINSGLTLEGSSQHIQKVLDACS